MSEEQRLPESLNDSQKARPNAKHVSRACLECRHRHLRCDGQYPKCGRCTQHDKECSYVKSNRGGSRKKGVKKAKPSKTDITDVDIEVPILPCIPNNGGPVDHNEANCPNGHDKESCSFLRDGSQLNLPCTKKQKANTIQERGEQNVNMEPFHKQPSAAGRKFLDQVFDNSSIINNYYTRFHVAHPLLPSIDEIDNFLLLSDEPRELLAVMKLIGDGYTSSKYSKNINQVFDIVIEINGLIEKKPRDLITLQTLILLSLVCHISALHDLSTSIRKKCMELAIHLDINNLDIERFKGDIDINGNSLNKKGASSSAVNGLTPTGSVDELNVNFYNTKRVRNLEEETLKDCARRCFWELFFLDIIIGCSDGKTVSSLTSLECFVNFPNKPDRFEFDYETRAHTSKLVDDSVRLNNIIFSNVSIGHQYTKLSASLSNWELKFSNPDFYKLPYLVDGMGRINNGVHQGILMLNYAKIFTHRPLSFLWRPDIPKNLKCVEFLNDQLNKTDDNCQDLPSDKDLIKSRKIIETRKTIDAANSISKTLIDTNPLDILKRTPLSACSLAFAGLVHLSSYLWYSQVIQSKDPNLGSFNSNELNIYEEYLKLELSGIYQISSHWYLSSKIANYLLESITKLLPDLADKLHSHFHNDANYANVRAQKEDENEFDASRSINSTNIDNLSISNNSESTPVNHVSTPLNGSSTPGTDFNRGFPNDPTYSSLNLNTVQQSDLPWPNSEEPMSPQSDTGCNWIDKNQLDFEFNDYNFAEFDLNTINAIDDMIKNATTN
ncbi:hypothetical protein WICANDRAFT_29552 [Wickerhamomyces anomalus NRRL Y-366-8]|uniref:Zn(2)-C6 fungal-type domain-containing protein n=1 Tax=Wickerhamomyces anomalus (strain ATCC 58044 / CBS 1984 / NCYC 433 / NRRL Y-366-8) TaxID=683960 RepID=A0A1E3P6D3_WICAA|nr:uncharacterized protein WICANDRAFT_29552 [Wickerhamomyces anomalus NRRL Y-366-8]ODQ60979.1 hypothetical protein WICANDRAFT_29552 [Wickerhamomyces anomalus NRRL Y-366-8]